MLSHSYTDNKFYITWSRIYHPENQGEMCYGRVLSILSQTEKNQRQRTCIIRTLNGAGQCCTYMLWLVFRCVVNPSVMSE